MLLFYDIYCWVIVIKLHFLGAVMAQGLSMVAFIENPCNCDVALQN